MRRRPASGSEIESALGLSVDNLEAAGALTSDQLERGELARRRL